MKNNNFKSLLKNKLIAAGYIDNCYLDLYITLLSNNLTTEKTHSTQAHHIIPVITYWKSNDVYNRQEALRLAKQDPNNKEINLLYSDHLLAHAYLTLCTNLEKVQIKYDMQKEIRTINSKHISGTKEERHGVYNKSKLYKAKLYSFIETYGKKLTVADIANIKHLPIREIEAFVKKYKLQVNK